MNQILILAHAPLAHALRDCALHVFPDCGERVLALDVQPQDAPEDVLRAARALLRTSRARHTLVLTDVLGATPSNVVQRLLQEHGSAQALAGVNLPMLLRAVCYMQLQPCDLLERALSGGSQGMVELLPSLPETLHRSAHDCANHHHQQ